MVFLMKISFICVFIINKWCKHFKRILFSVKRKLYSGLKKAWGLLAFSKMCFCDFARFEFRSAIYYNFCSFEFHLFIDSGLWLFYAWKAILLYFYSF